VNGGRSSSGEEGEKKIEKKKKKTAHELCIRGTHSPMGTFKGTFITVGRKSLISTRQRNRKERPIESRTDTITPRKPWDLYISAGSKEEITRSRRAALRRGV